MGRRLCDSYDELTTQLKNLLHDLNQTYQQIFAKIGPHCCGIVLTILQWLAFSKAPLTLDQICEVVGIVMDDNQYPKFEPGKKWTRQSVERNCANLVTVMDEEIKLAHFSVKEYLIGLGPKFDKEHSSCFIAKSCLGYLFQFTTLDSLNRENINNFQLAPYAAKYWVDHSQDAGEGSGESSESSVLEKLMDDLLQPSGAAFVTWVQVPAASSLYYASFLGLFHQVQILIQKGEDVNAQGGCFGHALQAASYKGDQEIVKLLIEKRADVNAQGGEYGNALQAASYSYKRNQKIVKLLIEKGADVNAQGGGYGNALQAAS
ncbi:ankyrin, partial [Tricholoma matsutake]